MHRKSEPATAWSLIALVWLAGLGAAAQFGKIAVTLPEFRAIYAVSEVQLGFLISSVGAVGLIFGALGGALLVRIGTRACFVWGMAGAGLFSLAQASLPPFGWMIALRLLEGASHLAIVIAGPILMARHSSAGTRSGVMTLWSSFFGVSYMAVALLSGPVVSALGLSGFLVCHGAFMLVLAGLGKLMLPAPTTAPVLPEAVREIPLTPRAFALLHWRIYASPFQSAAALGFVCYTILYIALLTYLPEFAAPEQRRPLSASMPFFSILTSLTLGVFILTRLPSVKAVQLGFAIQALAVLLLWPTEGSAAFALAVIVLLASSGLVPGASFAALADLNQSDAERALATGALAQMGNVGTTLGPPLLAAIVSAAGLSGLVLYVVCFSCLGILIHSWLSRRRAAQQGAG